MLHLPTPNADDIAEFKKLYLEDKGIELSNEEALGKIIGLLHILALTITQEQWDEYLNSQKQ
jgi:predicted RecA/RadA family phage recombinase